MFTRIAWGLLAGFLGIQATFAAQFPKQSTFIYKQVGDLQIKADVHHHPNANKRPVVVWLHGGALINGHRAGISGVVRNFALTNGYILVSFDYRLAPETKLPNTIEDIEDAFRWLRRDGPKLFHADPQRIAVTGGSAGGYLTLITGHRVKPSPKALLAFWGYGDLVGEWYSKPSPHPRHNRTKISREDAFAQVNGPPVADARERKGNGSLFYLYCRQTGQWPRLVSGWNPNTDSDRFTPYMPVKNVTADYPPTVLVHGTEDTDVPHEQSVMMVQEFKKHGVAHQFHSIANGEHGLAGADRSQVNAAYTDAFAFLRNQLRQ